MTVADLIDQWNTAINDNNPNTAEASLSKANVIAEKILTECNGHTYGAGTIFSPLRHKDCLYVFLRPNDSTSFDRIYPYDAEQIQII